MNDLEKKGVFVLIETITPPSMKGEVHDLYVLLNALEVVRKKCLLREIFLTPVAMFLAGVIVLFFVPPNLSHWPFVLLLGTSFLTATLLTRWWISSTIFVPRYSLILGEIEIHLRAHPGLSQYGNLLCRLDPEVGRIAGELFGVHEAPRPA